MNNITILVVDDESRMRKLIKDFLTAKGYQTIEAEDGELIKNLFNKAMDRIKEKYPDKTLYMIDGRYLGNTLEIITI